MESIVTSTTETIECAVCCGEINKTTHAKISCEHSGACSFDACKNCVKTYLLGISSDPNCMSCNKAWSDKFIAQNLGSSFLRGEYSTHRKELLLQQQLSRMPESIAAAETFKQVKILEEQITSLYSEKKTLAAYSKEIELKIQGITRTIIPGSAPRNIKSRFVSEEHKQLNAEINKCLRTKSHLQGNIQQLRHDIAIIKNGGVLVGEEKKEARKFIMPCPNSTCRGYLSSQYKCELCEHHTCSKCFELIGLTKDEANPHLCKPENVESAEFIKKQSKPCPCCAARISKIDGCDQMWCTQCHKAFSWNTGKIVSGTIHNPHFYQYQRENGGEATRNPGDVICGGLPNVRVIQAKCYEAKLNRDNQALLNDIMDAHRLQGHFTAIYLTTLRRECTEEQNLEKERIEYILQEITREELATKIIRKDNARKKKTAVLHICELFTTVAIDVFHRIEMTVKTGEELVDELKGLIYEYDNLRKYCNEHFKEISMLYGVCVPAIAGNWTLTTTKFNCKGDVDKYIEKRDSQRKEREIMKTKIIEEKEAARHLAYRARQKAIAEDQLRRQGIANQ